MDAIMNILVIAIILTGLLTLAMINSQLALARVALSRLTLIQRNRAG